VNRAATKRCLQEKYKKVLKPCATRIRAKMFREVVKIFRDISWSPLPFKLHSPRFQHFVSNIKGFDSLPNVNLDTRLRDTVEIIAAKTWEFFCPLLTKTASIPENP
jgi:hypothetical protein